jgi:hypothetical protein
VGIGYVQEVVARLENHTLGKENLERKVPNLQCFMNSEALKNESLFRPYCIQAITDFPMSAGYSGSQINTTLDNNTVTFPLNQSLYFDFSHDTNIMSILTAFGFKQFKSFLPSRSNAGPHDLTVSYLEPFGARLDIEVIKTPKPLNLNRKYVSGNETAYVHFILNQRTLPLGSSFPECGNRLDGWCELETFLDLQRASTALADYDYACNGDYPAAPYGEVTNGAPNK